MSLNIVECYKQIVISIENSLLIETTNVAIHVVG